MSCSFAEFDVGHMQHQLLRAPGLRAQKTFNLYLGTDVSLRNQARLRLESHRADFRPDLSLAPRLALLRLVVDLEFDARDAGGRGGPRTQPHDFPRTASPITARAFGGLDPPAL